MSYHPGSPLLGSPARNAGLLISAYLRLTAQSPHPATAREAQAREYVASCAACGLDPAIVMAQVIHETGALTSWWCQPPRHNPAGISVTGETSPSERPGYVYNPGTGRYHRGSVYVSLVAAVEPHVARLLCYACGPEDLAGRDLKTLERRRLIASAPTFPRPCLGTAATLAALGQRHNPKPATCGWAWPGEDYGAKLAIWANRLAEGMGPAPDPWAAWGDAFPLAEEQRAWSIPQAWLRAGDLGAATSPEIYIDTRPGYGISIQTFACGWIVYEQANGAISIARRTGL